MGTLRARRGLAGVTVAELETELQRRHKDVGKLKARYEKLTSDLATLAAQIESYGGSVTGHPGIPPGRKRARNKMKLADALANILDGKTMSVTDVAEAVQKAGYITTSPSFRTIVNQTLINTGRFKRVERGLYTVK